ncbi:MAG: UvrD-helicase domain-containing protein [Candidatus Brocadiia bacterium]
MSTIPSSNGNLLVRACAGAGKTRELVNRYFGKYLAGKNLLAITFTELAAGEMRARIAREIKKAGEAARAAGDAAAEANLRRLLIGVPNLPISTFHSFCRSLLLENASLAGVEPDFTVLDAVVSAELRGQAVFEAIESAVEDLASFGEDAGPVSLVLESVEPGSLANLLSSALSQPDLADAFDKSRRDSLPPFSPPPVVAHPEPLAALLGIPVSDIEGHLADLSATFLTLRLEPRKAASFRSEAKKRGLERFDRPEIIAAADEIGALLLGLVKARRFSLLAGFEVKLFKGFCRLLLLARERFDVLKEGALDFQDLQRAVEKLLCESAEGAEVLRSLAARYDHIFVDEFQDTDFSQWRIVKALATGSDGRPVPDRLFLVGDAQQSIYAFRGADVALFDSSASEVEAGTLELSNNYRSLPAVIDFCNLVFAPLFGDSLLNVQGVRHLPMGTGRRMQGESSPGAVSIVISPESASEAAVAAEEVDRLCRVDGRICLPERGIAVLARTHSDLSALVPHLARLGIPFSLKLGDDFSSRQEVSDVSAAIRAVLDRDDYHVAQFLRSPMCGLSDAALFVISRATGDSLADKLSGVDPGRLETGDRLCLLHASAFLSGMRACFATRPLDKALDELFEACGVPLCYAATDYGSVAIENLLCLRAFADQFAESGRGVSEFADFITGGRLSASGPGAMVPGRVNLLTIHASKGLEFHTVVVIGAGKGKNRGHNDGEVRFVTMPDIGRIPIPDMGIARDAVIEEMPEIAQLPGQDGKSSLRGFWSQTARDTRAAVESSEELRLYYVACTRARDRLTILGSCQSGKAGIEFSKGSFLARIAASILPDLRVEPGAVRKFPCGESEAEIRLASAPPPAQFSDAAVIKGVFDSLRPPEPSRPPAALSAPAVPIGVVSLAALLAGGEDAQSTVPEKSSDGPRESLGLVFGSALHLLLQRRPQAPSDEIDRTIALGLVPGNLRESLLRAYERTIAGVLPLVNVAGARLYSEYPFLLKWHGYLLRGRMDLLSVSGDSAVIVDFKSGNPPRERKSLDAYCYQAALYSVAARSLLGVKSARAFLYFTTGGEITEGYTDSDLEKALADAARKGRTD